MELKDKKILLALQMKKAVELLETNSLDTATFDQIMLAVRKNSIELKKEFKLIRADGNVSQKTFIHTPIKRSEVRKEIEEVSKKRIKPKL